MHGLIGGHGQEIIDKPVPHCCAEPANDVERQVDRDKFNMRQRMP